jgi:hypothetical protein
VYINKGYLFDILKVGYKHISLIFTPSQWREGSEYTALNFLKSNKNQRKSTEIHSESEPNVANVFNDGSTTLNVISTTDNEE